MIPKIIHYCWFGGKPLPKDVKKCIESWKRFCPDYKIIEWNETNFDVECHPFVKQAYKEKAWSFVSDYARLKVVYENGGIYFDTDVELLRNMDFLLENPCYIGVQQCQLLCNTGLGFGAVRFSPVVKKMLEEYDEVSFRLDKKEELACPYLNSKVIEKLGYHYREKIVKLNDVTVYPPCYFDPLAPGNTSNLLCKETVSIHHYSASWTSKNNQFRRKLLRKIGDEKVYKIKKMLKRR